MAEPGIDRVNGSKANWTRNDIENILKPGTIWDPDKYFNVWVLEFASSEKPAGLCPVSEPFDAGGNPRQ